MLYTCGPCGVKRNLWNACPGIVPRATTCHDCGAQAVFMFNSDKTTPDVSPAFKAGYLAADDGKSTTDNPYDRYTAEYDSWCRGYEERKSI